MAKNQAETPAPIDETPVDQPVDTQPDTQTPADTKPTWDDAAAQLSGSMSDGTDQPTDTPPDETRPEAAQAPDAAAPGATPETQLLDGIDNPDATKVDEQPLGDQNPFEQIDPQSILESFKSLLEEAKQGGAAEPADQTPETPATPELDQEKFLEMFQDNPAEALKMAQEIEAAKLESKIMDKLAPLLSDAEEAKARKEVGMIFDQFFAENPDAHNYLDSIKEHLAGTNDPLNDPRTIKDAYQTAKLKDLSGRKSLDEYMNDPEALAQMVGNNDFIGRLLGNKDFVEKAKGNEDLKKQYIADYAAELQAGAKPAVLTDAGGVSPATPPKSISSWDDAQLALANSMR